MAWELLRTDYVDAVFEGLRKYQQITNADETVSFADVTQYTVKEGAFIGAKDINAITAAINAIMASLEQGTDLYAVFTQFFEVQKGEFEESADANLKSFQEYTSNLEGEADKTIEQIKTDYDEEIKSFEQLQEALFTQWFDLIKGQLSTDAAGNLQLQINALSEKVFERYYGLAVQNTEFMPDGSIVTTNAEATITTVFGKDENGNKVITETIAPTDEQKIYKKVTTITTATETENKKISEVYTVE